MKNFKRRFILIGIFALLFLLIVGIWPKSTKKTERFVQDSNELAELVKKSSEIQRIWWEGEDSSIWSEVKEQCLNLYGIKNSFDESLMRCNPMLLNCMNLFSKKWKDSIDENIFLTSAQMGLGGGYQVKLLGKNNRHLNILLKDFCHESFLEEKTYAYGEMPKKNEGEDFLFDNINQKIYLDKHLVTKREYQDFQKASGQISNERATGDELFLPIDNISLQDMHNYCLFKGKELMNAHIFDAATFLWNDNSPGSKWLRRSAYYWTKNLKSKIESCDQVFTKECIGSHVYKINSISPSWAGLQDSMGGVMEVFKNPIEPDKNLKVSSFYLSRSSIWHALGKRAKWTGEGNDLRYFDLEDAEIDPGLTSIRVGFRCMRRVWQ